jgi:hypothetical protein
MFDSLILAAERRAQAYDQQHAEGQEEDCTERERLAFSIRVVVDEHGPNSLRNAIRLTVDEFQELCQIVQVS